MTYSEPIVRILLPSFVSFWLILAPTTADSAEPVEPSNTTSIQYTGIASLDLLVRDLRLLDQDLTQLEAAIQVAENHIKEALGAPENMTLEDAVADFQQRETRTIRIVWIEHSLQAQPIAESNEHSTHQSDLINKSIVNLRAIKEQLAQIPNRFSELQPELNRVRTGAADAGREAMMNTRERIDLMDQIQHNEAIAAGFSPRATDSVRHANLILYYLENIAR